MRVRQEVTRILWIQRGLLVAQWPSTLLEKKQLIKFNLNVVNVYTQPAPTHTHSYISRHVRPAQPIQSDAVYIRSQMHTYTQTQTNTHTYTHTHSDIHIYTVYACRLYLNLECFLLFTKLRLGFQSTAIQVRSTHRNTHKHTQV